MFNTYTFNPIADAYTNEGSATTNYGTATTLRADATPVVRSYLRFKVQGLSGSITHVTLRIYTNSTSSAGYEVRNVADNTWVESTINHTNAPAVSGVSATSGAFGSVAWTSVDITSLITAAALIALTTTSGTAFSLASAVWCECSAADHRNRTVGFPGRFADRIFKNNKVQNGGVKPTVLYLN
jgi:hypothetical protein